MEGILCTPVHQENDLRIITTWTDILFRVGSCPERRFYINRVVSSYYSSGPASPRACRLVGASALKYGFSASEVTLVPCRGSVPP